MKRIAVLLTLLASATCGAADTYLGGGGMSYSTFILDKTAKFQLNEWVLRYLSGLNLAKPIDVLSDNLIIGDIVIRAVERYCKKTS